MVGKFLITTWCIVTFVKGLHAECQQVRLALSSKSDRGVLEVLQNGSWGSVCDQYFTNKAATVVCNNLTKPILNAYRIHTSAIVQANSEHPPQSVVTRVRCEGSETSFCACSVTSANKKCSEASLIGVVCTDVPVPATWQYKGLWLPSHVKEVNVTEGDDISCAAINDQARFMTTRIYIPGESKSLRSGEGKQTVHTISRKLDGSLACSISNWKFQNQSVSKIQLNVITTSNSWTPKAAVFVMWPVAVSCLMLLST